MKNFFLITILLTVAMLQSCTRAPFQDDKSATKGKLSIKLNTEALAASDIPITKVRFIAYDRGLDKIRLNASLSPDGGNDTYLVSIPLGEYDFYAIVNEPANLTTALDEVASLDALNLITIQPETPFTEKTVMLVKKETATITVGDAGQTLVDGSATNLSMALERAYIKVSLNIRKKTIESGDEFEIKHVDFVQAPKYSYLNAKNYDESEYAPVRTIFTGSKAFQTNGDTYEEIVSVTPTNAAMSNIFAEYLLSDTDKANHDKAAYLGVLANYKKSGSSMTQEVYYKIPVGNYTGNSAANDPNRDYSLKRNQHYIVDATITKIGSTDAVIVEYTVKDWGREKIDIELDGDPFLDVSNVEVDVYDAAATRVYFYSNMPEVKIDDMLLNGTQSIAVNSVFDGLSGTSAKNLTYNYNQATKRGEGYFDLINIHTSNSVREQRKLYLRSGTLVREIIATTRISAEAEKNNSLPFVGTFHRYMEHGERIVSWHLPTTTGWKVEVVTDATVDAPGNAGAKYYTDAAFLRIDRLASPNHSKLYTLEPPSAEGANVTDSDGARAPITKIEGSGRVYFRVGWTDALKSATDHRFAKIKVTTSTDNFVANNVVSYLYCRQGEEPIEIISKSTIFASYNISTPETFVDYPSKSGYLYQWNHTVPWAVTGTMNNYLTGDFSDPQATDSKYKYNTYVKESYICPAKYSYPDNGALTVMNAALNSVMYQWGYYADGFFDRRAVSENIVRNAVGEIASAGGLFYSGTTAIAIFLPTASWRDYQGAVNNLVGHQDMGVIGHYWSLAQDGEWAADGSGSPVSTATLNAMALHLTRTASPDSKLEPLNKASAASVRCMRLDGETVYFDANGGLTTPRSMTVAADKSITFPAGPKHSDPALGFVDWASARGGSATTHKAGVSVPVANLDKKTWYAQYKKLGDNIDGKILVVSDANDSNITYTNAIQFCTNTINGYADWRLPTVFEIPLLNKVITGLIPSNKLLWAEGDSGKYYTFAVGFGGTVSDPVSQGSSFSTNARVRCVRQLN